MSEDSDARYSILAGLNSSFEIKQTMNCSTNLFHSEASSISIITTKSTFFATPLFPCNAEFPQFSVAIPFRPRKFGTLTSHTFVNQVVASDVVTVETNDKDEVEIAEGYTMTQFCDKMIDVFLNERSKSKDWKKLLVYREEWKKYRDAFYSRCQIRADSEHDSQMKESLVLLARKIKKIDDAMEEHAELVQEIQDSPTDINAIVAKRRKDFTGEFFQHIKLHSEVSNTLEDRDGMARLASRCLSAVSVYDNTLENVESLDSAQAKFEEILNSSSIEKACDKIKSLAKSKELDSSLILLINSAWAKAKESTTMKNEVKEIMYQLYKATKNSLKSISPKELRLLKYLLNITDPEERFSALATAFSPGDVTQAKDRNAVYTTPKELHKWIKIMLDAYHLNKEETEIREAKKMEQPMVIQRLFILKETIEEEYLEKPSANPDNQQQQNDSKSEIDEFL